MIDSRTQNMSQEALEALQKHQRLSQRAYATKPKDGAAYGLPGASKSTVFPENAFSYDRVIALSWRQKSGNPDNVGPKKLQNHRAIHSLREVEIRYGAGRVTVERDGWTVASIYRDEIETRRPRIDLIIPHRVLKDADPLPSILSSILRDNGYGDDLDISSRMVGSLSALTLIDRRERSEICTSFTHNLISVSQNQDARRGVLVSVSERTLLT